MNKTSFRLKIIVQTGLHIGSGNDKVQIGGVDSEVIKDPITKLPYIPGSSLKGKIRCLLETESKIITSDELKQKNNAGELNDKLNKYFGINVQFKKKMDIENEERKNRNEEPIEYETPTRIIFRDLHLSEGYSVDNKVINYKKEFLEGKLTTEFKSEISIDRKKGTVTPAGPRTIERVPPQVVFEGDILIRYENNNELKDIKNVLKEGLELLKNDYLGGSGSRGYGAVTYEVEPKDFLN
ncbi:MAG: type III-A CRISPR-associated RAMP protein Csm3 [Melioribacteraceae bacterium]